MKQHSQVLIVGAGPAGLTLATALRRYGVTVRIVDRKSGPSTHTKATNLMQRNQELIAALGALEPLTEQSGHMRRLMVSAYGANLGPRTMRLAESPYTDVLLCGQDRFEAVMNTALREAGTVVEWDHTLTDLVQHDTGIAADLLAPDGSTERVTADWAVGCDGAAGISRTFTRHDFTPQRTGVAIRQVDATLRWRRSLDAEQMWLLYFTNGFGVVVPLPGGAHRILTVEPVGAIPARRPTLAEMETALRSMTGDPSASLTDERWSSYTDLAMGIAPALRDGRIFLAGDVGNPILPNGGQGMNIGIADAYDLARKLASRILFDAPDRLLDTYNTERHALRTVLQKAQYNSLKYTTLTTPAPMRAAFRLLAEPVLNHGAEYRIAQAFSELSITTRESPLTLEHGPRSGLRAGDRALDAPLADAPAGHLYDLIYRGGWSLLAFSGRDRRARSSDTVQAMSRYANRVATYLVAADARATTPEATIWDLDGEVHRLYGISNPRLVLVRPDGHIAARVTLDRHQSLDTYLTAWGVPAGLHFLAADASYPWGPRASA